MEPMDVEAPRPKRLPSHIKRLRDLEGCGRKKLQTLAGAFPTQANLSSATEKDFKNLPGIGAPLAKKLYAYSRSEAAPVPAVEKRIPMWNKMSKKKLAGAAAPRESEVDAWMAAYAGIYERFDDQDLKQKGPNDVPDDDIIDGPEFQDFWSTSSGMPLGEAQQALTSTLTAYALKPLEVTNVSAGLPAPGSLIFALLHAAANLDGDVSSLLKELESVVGEALPVETRVMQMIRSAHRQLKRPVWAFACSSPAATAAASSSAAEDDVKVFQHDPELSDTSTVTPIRIALMGGHFFALVELDHTAAVDVTVPDAVARAQLPDIKDDVDRALSDVHAQIDTVEKWSRVFLGEPYELSRPRETIEHLRERLTNRIGQSAAFLGMNGVGKSFIINVLVLNSSVDAASYKSQPGNYVPEALLNVWPSSGDGPPAYHELLAGRGTGRDDVTITLLEPPGGDFNAAAKEAADKHHKMEDSIKRFCEVGGDKPQITNYVLPSGEGSGSTTALHTRVRYGQVVHLFVEYYTVPELQKNAFNFVQLMHDYEYEGTEIRTLSKEEKEALQEAWYVYLNIKQGPLKRKELPRISQLPKIESLEKKWEDIEVVQELKDLVSSQSRIFLGTGRSLHLDRIMVHDHIKKMNDKEQLDRYAVKSVETYQPAGVLEGGNTFVDLPGQNDVDTGCTAQTREGIKEAGVIFVVLSKSLYEDKSSLKLLQESDTIKRTAAGEANVVFLFNREPSTTFKHRQLETEAEVAVRAALETQTRELWHEELLEANDEAQNAGDPSKTEEEIKKLADNTLMRTIYPMLHSSFKLNWQYAETHKETEGELSGSTRTFELSNVPFMLGILEMLNRSSIVDNLQQIATTVLPAVHEKLRVSLMDAKNAQGGLPEKLVGKAAQFLKGKRSLEGALSVQANQLNESAVALGSTAVDAEATSFRLQMDSFVKDFMEGPEVTTYLDRARGLSDARWESMSKSMKRVQQGAQAIDPRNRGNFLGFSMLPMIFGHNSRQAPIDFKPMVDELEVKLDAMMQKVVDLVIEHVKLLLSRVLGDEPCPSMASLKESFLELDVIKPLQQRFKVEHFVKVCQRDPMLNDGKLEHYLKKYAAQMSTEAVKRKILSRACNRGSIVAIKDMIESSREPTREKWQELMQDSVQHFFGGQFQHLLNDLTWHKKRSQSYSLKAMLIAFLQHIVNTDRLNQKVELQNDLSGFIKDLAFKTDSLHSLWARLDGQDDPDVLGAAAARHVERRRQRELAAEQAIQRLSNELKKPNRTMPVTELQRDHRQCEQGFDVVKHIFVSSQEDMIGEVRAALRERYNLSVFHSPGNFKDLFTAVIHVMYTTIKIKGAVGSAEATLSNEQHVERAATQLRAVAAAQIAHYHRTEDRHKTYSAIIGEKIESYIEKVQGPEYRGDLFCLFFLANHFQRNFRVWLPGVGSILVKGDNRPSSSTRSGSACAFQLMLVAQKPEQPGTAGYNPQWMPVQLTELHKVGFAESNRILELPMTDDDCDARLTEDAEPMKRIGMTNKRVDRHRQGQEMGPLAETCMATAKRPRR